MNDIRIKISQNIELPQQFYLFLLFFFFLFSFFDDKDLGIGNWLKKGASGPLVSAEQRFFKSKNAKDRRG